jgi:hypothetical protein
MVFNSGPTGTVTICARLGYWAGVTSGTAWFDDLRVTEIRATDPHPSWKVLVLIYDGTDFTCCLGITPAAWATGGPVSMPSEHTADAFHYLHQPIRGDFQVVVRAATVEHVDRWTKAGLMIRETLAPGARHASLFATPTTERPVADSPAFSGQDIGAVSAPGSSGLHDGVFSATGAGADIWGTADAFHYLHQPIRGDFQVVVRAARRSGWRSRARATGLAVPINSRTNTRRPCATRSSSVSPKPTKNGRRPVGPSLTAESSWRRTFSSPPSSKA